jgi:hypothetical protein
VTTQSLSTSNPPQILRSLASSPPFFTPPLLQPPLASPSPACLTPCLPLPLALHVPVSSKSLRSCVVGGDEGIILAMQQWREDGGRRHVAEEDVDSNEAALRSLSDKTLSCSPSATSSISFSTLSRSLAHALCVCYVGVGVGVGLCGRTRPCVLGADISFGYWSHFKDGKGKEHPCL